MRRFVIGAVVLLAATAAAVVLVVARTERTLRASRVETAEAAKIDFDLTSSRTDAFKQNGPGFEELAAPSAYTVGAVFDGKTVLGGPGGLTISEPGKAALELRAGLELPAATITGLTVGRLRGREHAELIAATRGEGVLFLSGEDDGAIRQLRPRDAGLRDVTAVIALASGELLIGTRNKGLLRWDGKTLAQFNAGLAGVPVTALAGDGAELWVGTRDRGVYRWHAGQLDHIDREKGLADEQVESIALGWERGVFVGTPMGVDEFVGSELSLQVSAGLFAHAMGFDGDALYVATVDQGIVRIASPDVVREHQAIRAVMPEPVKAESFFKADGGLFAVTANGVMERGKTGTWNAVRLGDGEASAAVMEDRNVSALSFAGDGRLWVGYFDHGLDVVDVATKKTRHVEDDHVFCVNRIVKDPVRGTMDVATANGLVLFDAGGRERQVMMRRDGLIADQVTDVAFARGGTVLATPAGITFVDASGVSSLYGFQGLVNNHVYALATDGENGTLMAGTLGGISMLGDTATLRDATVRRNLTSKNSGLKQNWITAIVPVAMDDGAKRQEWFVGTYGAGVMELGADGQFVAGDGMAAKAVINPNAMLVTERHVFAGSLGDGLLVYDRASRHWSEVKAGLPSLNVTALAERGGEVYVGTENGVVHAAEARLAR